MTISASTISSALICSRVRFTFSLLCEYGSLRSHYATLSKKLKCTHVTLDVLAISRSCVYNMYAGNGSVVAWIHRRAHLNTACGSV